jgi:hypothetical protein
VRPISAYNTVFIFPFALQVSRIFDLLVTHSNITKLLTNDDLSFSFIALQPNRMYMFPIHALLLTFFYSILAL